MHYMALPVSFRWDEAFVARIDEARGDVPRSAFVRRAVEQALSEAKEPLEREQAGPGSVPPAGGVRLAAPAEPLVRSSGQAKQNVRPLPKTQKR